MSTEYTLHLLVERQEGFIRFNIKELDLEGPEFTIKAWNTFAGVFMSSTNMIYNF